MSISLPQTLQCAPNNFNTIKSHISVVVNLSPKYHVYHSDDTHDASRADKTFPMPNLPRLTEIWTRSNANHEPKNFAGEASAQLEFGLI